MEYRIIVVNGHVEVLDRTGRFLFPQIRSRRPSRTFGNCSHDPSQPFVFVQVHP